MTTTPTLVIASYLRRRVAKQSIRIDKLKAPSLSRGWVATARFARLAMTIV
jgi:hypothetical protein